MKAKPSYIKNYSEIQKQKNSQLVKINEADLHKKSKKKNKKDKNQEQQQLKLQEQEGDKNHIMDSNIPKNSQINNKSQLKQSHISKGKRGAITETNSEVQSKIMGNISTEEDLVNYLKKVEAIIEKSKGITEQERIAKVDIKNERVDSDNKYIVRRWEVKIREMRVQSLQKDELNIFLVVKIGAKFKDSEPKEAEIVDNSKTLKTFRSEICKEIQKGETRVINSGLDTEIHASYDMLNSRYLIIEIWEYSRWKLNKFLGKAVIPLLEVAQNDLRSSVVIKKAFGDKKGFCRVYYLAYFQEIWDYFITFYNWKAYNVVNKHSEPMNTALKITLKDKEHYNMSVKSAYYGVEDANPAWDHIPGFIQFRGTIDDLEDQMIEVHLIENKTLGVDTEERKVLLSLRGVSNFDCFKGLIKLKQEDKKKSKRKNKKDKQLDLNPTENDDEEDEGGKEVDLKFDTTVYATVEGRINRCENVMAPDDRGVINSYVTVKCGGTTKKTSTKYDNTKPDFNEELVFKIPIVQPHGIFGGNKVKELEMINDQIRDWLKKNNQIHFILWLDGEDIMSDDNLGYTICNISDIQNSPLEPKSFTNYETKKTHNFVTRVLTATNKFTSSRSDAGNIKITYQVYFSPDIDKAIDLKDFIGSNQDKYPEQITEKMKYKDDPQKCQYYQEYQQKIQSTFSVHPLERNAYQIFYKNIFVKDQYSNYHYLPKFVERFSLPNQIKVQNGQDLSLSTQHELAHYVRCIPLVNKKPEVWNSPEFMLALRVGNHIDHALLMAGLFMTIDEEEAKKRRQTPQERVTEKQHFKNLSNKLDFFKKSKYDPYDMKIPIEDRVFICLGTLKNTEITAWVMVIDENLVDITFWDVIEHKEYKLEGRIVDTKIGQKGQVTKKNKQDSVKYKMRKLLHPYTSDLADDKFIFFNEKKQEKVEEKEEKLDESQDSQSEDEGEEQKRREEEKLLKDKSDQKQEMLQSKIVGLNQQSNTYQSKAKMQGIRKLMQSNVGEDDKSIKSGHSINSKLSLKSKQLQSSRLFGMSQLKGQGIDNNNNSNIKQSFFEKHKQIQQELEMHNDAVKFTKLGQFVDINDQEITDDVPELPYKTLELIFNSRNIYANVQNQDPALINYHLFDESHWYPFVYNEKEVKRNKMTGEIEAEKVVKRWQGKIDTFWEGRNPHSELSADKVKQKEKDIVDEIKLGIENCRASQNLLSKWKSESDVTTKKLIELLQMQEYRDLGRDWIYQKEVDPVLKKKVDMYLKYDDALTLWQNDMKALLPQDYQFIAVPLSFTYTDYMRIKALVIENLEGLFTKKGKKLVFGVACKIFNYPNKINSTRIVLACYFNRTEAFQGGDDEDEENKENSEQEAIEEEDEEEVEEDEEQDELLNLNQKKEN